MAKIAVDVDVVVVVGTLNSERVLRVVVLIFELVVERKRWTLNVKSVVVK